jgi:hypothetical protein
VFGLFRGSTWRPIILADNPPPFRYNLSMPSAEKLAEFAAWCRQHLDGDEKGEAQIFLDHWTTGLPARLTCFRLSLTFFKIHGPRI